VFQALVAELRMLSSASDDGSALVSPSTIVKSEPPVRSDSVLMPNLLEPGALFTEAYPDHVIASLRRLVFDQPSRQTDAYQWKSLGYWFCYQLLSKSSDVLSQAAALRYFTDVSAAFHDGLRAVTQRYFVVRCVSRTNISNTFDCNLNKDCEILVILSLKNPIKCTGFGLF